MEFPIVPRYNGKSALMHLLFRVFPSDEVLRDKGEDRARPSPHRSYYISRFIRGTSATPLDAVVSVLYIAR